MSPLIRKEIRLMLPAWGLAMLLAIVPAWLMSDQTFGRQIDAAVFWLFSFGVLLLGLAPFGQEFGIGAFSSMLAQPIKRRQIWNTKILLLAAAAALVFLAFILSLHERLSVIVYSAENQKEQAAELWQASSASLLLIAVALSGGFWTTLLFRQTGAAMWFAVLIPGVLAIATEALFRGFSPSAQDVLLKSVLLCYSAAGFVWGYRMFVRAQDSQWLGENVALLSLSPAKRKAEDTTAPRRQGALLALVRKEFQSHQISLIIAFGLFVLHICTLFYRRFGNLSSNSEMRFAVEAVPFLWLLVPWLIGSVAIAEERKLGIMESQLCLPVSRRLQFAMKLIVVLLLGFALGGIVPSLLESLGARFHISSQVALMSQTARSSLVSSDFFGGGAYRGFILLCIIAVFFAAASFFASSLTRNSLQALGAAIFLGVALFALFQWVLFESTRDGYTLWKGPLILLIGVPVAAITVFWLSFSNYKTLHAGRNLWLRNLLILAVTLFLTGIGTAVVYQRPWELAMSLEPRHSSARLTGRIQPVIGMAAGRIFALLPDGRIWAATDYRFKEFDQYEEVWDPKGRTNRLQKLKLEFPHSGMFVGGSNWVTLAVNGGSFDVVALQSDGTLWEILALEDRTNRATWFSEMPEPRRFGSDSDWKSVAAGIRTFFAVKSDGTLWGWGRNESGELAADARDLILEPVQIGKESDWAAVLPRGPQPLFVKKDNAVFEFDWNGRQRHSALVKVSFSGKDMWAAAGFSDRTLVLYRDGSLHASGYVPRVLFGDHKIRLDASTEFLTRVGDRSDWAQVSGDAFFVALRRDGSLVKTDSELFSSILGQPSRYSDWLALNQDWNGLVALASDGTVSLWRDTRTRKGFLLAPTHRPLWSLNIFVDAKN